MKPEFEKRIGEYKSLIEKELETALRDVQFDVGEAMRYSVLNGGKRIRGVLTMEFCRVFGKNSERELEKAAYIAASIEMIHAFSLIHDDLPCMDNDDLRRGKPSCHKQFNEATALLAGDALLALAYNNAAALSFIPKGLKAERVVKIISTLSAATVEMIAGQQLDMDYEKAEKITEAQLLSMYNRKTANLISCSCVCGALVAGANDKNVHLARTYGQALGVAFQITDDLLDFKTEKHGKKTLPLIIGEEEARKKAEEITGLVIETADEIKGGEFLKDLALSLIDRRV
ncbi:MAG: polyprenyl synthetase family protein [Oscillospiraceae bacterium]|nr:polyprenyl synthetase family protein [Oscillospiraceae bacterium]